MDNIIVLLILGWAWNFIIAFKNMMDILSEARPLHRGRRLEQFDIVPVVYRRGWIPFYTLLTYKPFLNGYYEYRKEFPRSDSIDYCYYLSLKKFESKK